MKLATKTHEPSKTIVAALGTQLSAVPSGAVHGRLPTQPTRLTLSTPSENAWLGLGAGGKARRPGTSHELEPGIVAETDTHLHLWVRQSGPEGAEDEYKGQRQHADKDPGERKEKEKEKEKRKGKNAQGGPDAGAPVATGTSAQTECRTLLALGRRCELDPRVDGSPWSDELREAIVSEAPEHWDQHGAYTYTTGGIYEYAVGDCRFVSVAGNVVVRSRAGEYAYDFWKTPLGVWLKAYEEYYGSKLSDQPTAGEISEMVLEDLAWRGFSYATSFGKACYSPADLYAIYRALSYYLQKQEPLPSHATLYADDGQAHVLAGHDVVMASRRNVTISASEQMALPDPAKPGLYEAGIVETVKTYCSYAYTGITAVLGIYGFYVTMSDPIGFKSVAKTKAFVPKLVSLVSTVSKTALGLSTLAASLARPAANALAEWKGNVSIHADNAASLAGAAVASVYGTVSASLSSLHGASVSGAYTSVSGFMHSSLSSTLSTNVSSLKSTNVSSQYGTTSVTGGYLGLDLTSPKSDLTVAALKDVEIKTVSGSVYVMGSKRTLLAAGGDVRGWGLQADALGGVEIGPVAPMAPFNAAQVVTESPFGGLGLNGISVGPKQVAMRGAGGKVAVSLAGVQVTGNVLDIKTKAGAVSINGKPVLIG